MCVCEYICLYAEKIKSEKYTYLYTSIYIYI